MSDIILKEISDRSKPKQLPVIRTGYTVKVYQKIKEGNKERIQIFQGLVIKSNSGNGVDKTITVRKLVEGVGVEKIFPLYSPMIDKIEVIKIAKIRRSKLYYMRERTGKAARLKETWVGEGEAAMEIDEKDEPIVEEVVLADDVQAEAVEELSPVESEEKEEAKTEDDTQESEETTEEAVEKQDDKEEEKSE